MCIFRRIINKHTDESLGDCSFLNTCFHMDTCKYVHYEIDSPPEAEGDTAGPQAGAIELGLHSTDGDNNVGKLFPSQVSNPPTFYTTFHLIASKTSIHKEYSL